MVVLTKNYYWPPLFWYPRPLYYSLNHLQEEMGMSIELIDWLDSVLRLSAIFQLCNGGWTFNKWKNGKQINIQNIHVYFYTSLSKCFKSKWWCSTYNQPYIVSIWRKSVIKGVSDEMVFHQWRKMLWSLMPVKLWLIKITIGYNQFHIMPKSQIRFREKSFRGDLTSS